MKSQDKPVYYKIENNSFTDNSFNNSLNTSSKKNTPFRRVKDEDHIADVRGDNSFESKVSAPNEKKKKR